VNAGTIRTVYLRSLRLYRDAAPTGQTAENTLTKARQYAPGSLDVNVQRSDALQAGRNEMNAIRVLSEAVTAI